MVATLNQPQYSPWPMEEEVVALWVASNGFLDEIPVEDVPRYQDDLRQTMRANREVYEAIRDSGQLTDETQAKLRTQVEEFAKGFEVRDHTLVASEA
jgi:F-type H+-transporting ATPase subunit alpha